MGRWSFQMDNIINQNICQIMTQNTKQIIRIILLTLGIILLIIPVIFYWWLHGSYDRYLWIIHGPFPFSHLGSAPVQLFLGIGLFLGGVILIGVSWILTKRFPGSKS